MTDRLLEWMSYRESGQRNDLPKDLLASSNPFWMLEDLSLLAHIEIQQDGKWRVAPPAFAVIGNEADGGKTAILCGARTQGVVDRLTRACELNGGEVRKLQQTDRPQCIIVAAASASALFAIAETAGIPCQRDAGFTLLACLPTIRDWPRIPCPMVAGKVAEVKRFSKAGLHWIPSTLEEAHQADRGLFRIKRDWDWITLIKSGKENQSQIDVFAGRLAAAAGAKRIRLDIRSQTLCIPLALKPPIVVSRALTLCSGILPRIDRANGNLQLIFNDIPIRAARLAVAITGLRVE
jgi:hypothetical protein